MILRIGSQLLLIFLLLGYTLWRGYEAGAALLAPYDEIVAPPPSQALTVSQSSPVSFVQPAVSDFAVLSQRPLFFRGRKMPSPAKIAAATDVGAAVSRQTPALAATSSMKLKGVSRTAEGWRALIETSPRTMAWYSVGENTQGWMVAEIGSEHVTLKASDGSVSLELYPSSARR